MNYIFVDIYFFFNVKKLLRLCSSRFGSPSGFAGSVCDLVGPLLLASPVAALTFVIQFSISAF